MVSLRNDEIETIREDMAIGKLPPDALKTHFADEERRVFGSEFKRDRDGTPIENGIGSAAQPSKNSVEAYKIWGRNDPDFAANLASMERALAAHEARRRAKGPQS
jgi:hypothetical protein